MKHVGAEPLRRLSVKRSPLAHAEAVLLVDHRHGQISELDGGFDQGVGADDERQLPGGELAQEIIAPPGRG